MRLEEQRAEVDGEVRHEEQHGERAASSWRRHRGRCERRRVRRGESGWRSHEIRCSLFTRLPNSWPKEARPCTARRPNPTLIAARPSERTIRANMPLDYSSPTFVRAHPGRPGHRRTHSCPLSPAVSRVKSEASRRELELHASRLHAAVGRLTLLRGAINKDGAAARRTSPLSSPSQSPSSPRTVSPLSLRCHDEA